MLKLMPHNQHCSGIPTLWKADSMFFVMEYENVGN